MDWSKYAVTPTAPAANPADDEPAIDDKAPKTDWSQYEVKPAAAPVSIQSAPPTTGHPVVDAVLKAIHPYVSGMNSNVADLAGMPMDVATAATNILKGPVDYVKDKLGAPHGGAIDPAQVPGTSGWLKAKAEGAVPGSMEDADHPIAHGVGELVGPGGLEVAGSKIAGTVTKLANGFTDAGKLGALEGATAVKPSTGPHPSDADPLGTARAAGYKTTASNAAITNPTQKPGILNQAGEIASGGNDTITRANRADNSALSTKLAGQQMGLGDSVTKINVGDLKKAKAAPGAVYDATGAKMPDFEPSPNLMNQLKDAAADQSVQASPATRTAANKVLAAIAQNSGKYSGSGIVGDISALRESPNTRPIANMLDQEVGRQLTAQGDTRGLQNLLDARQKFAQIYTTQDALRGGQVDTQAIAKVHRDNPNLLTGNLRIIGHAGNELPNDTALPEAPTDGALDSFVRGSKAIAGSLIRPVMRSNAVQNQFGKVADATGKSYFDTFGEKPASPSEDLKLALAPGKVGRTQLKNQGELSVPQNPRPLIDLTKPEGQVGELTPVQGGLSVPEGPESITGAPSSSKEANNLIRPLGEAFQPHQKDLFPPNNVRVPKDSKPEGISDSDWKLLRSLGLGE